MLRWLKRLFRKKPQFIQPYPHQERELKMHSGIWKHRVPRNNSGHDTQWCGQADKELCTCKPRVDMELGIVIHRPLAQA